MPGPLPERGREGEGVPFGGGGENQLEGFALPGCTPVSPSTKAGDGEKLLNQIGVVPDGDEHKTGRPVVLFMVGRGGGGHKASAAAVRDCLLAAEAPWNHDIELIDTGAVVEKLLNGSLAKYIPSGDDMYNWFMKKGLYFLAGQSGKVAKTAIRQQRHRVERGFEELWRQRSPVLVVSFVPFLNALMRSALARACPEAWLVTVVTDMEHSSAHPWIESVAGWERNHIIVAGNDTLEGQARALGFHGRHLFRTSGMVVHPSFYESGRPPRSAPGEGGAPPAPSVEGTAVLFFGGFAPNRTKKVVEHALISHPTLAFVVICGGNSALEHRLRKLAGPRCTVEGFIPSERIRRHFASACCVLGKPGPGVVAEAAVCKVPFVAEVRKPMPQEKCVLQHIKDSGTGVLVQSLEKLPADLLARVASCRGALDAHSNKAVFEVSQLLRELATDATAGPVPKRQLL